jgi:hypothetical protein
VRLVTTSVQEREDDVGTSDLVVVVVFDRSKDPRPVGRSASEESTEEVASAQLAYIAEFGLCEKCCRCASLAVELLLTYGVKGASTALSRGLLRVVLRLDLLFGRRYLKVQLYMGGQKLNNGTTSVIG